MTSEKRRIRLLIEFDGTDFCGWAEQRGLRTVKGTLKSCIRQICGEEVDLRGASRTDSGAHAKGFVADFASANPMPTENWKLAINRQAGPAIRILDAVEVSKDFHSRFYARSRVYEYRIAESEHVDPRRARFVYGTFRKLDVEKMRKAAAALVGRNDFRAFGEELDGVENTLRDVKAISVRRMRDEVRIRIEATAFLRGMVRRIAGGLMEVGYGKRSLRDFGALLDPAKRGSIKWPVVLPAKGLTLLKVKYGRQLRDLRKTNDFVDGDE
ncbi:MAG: tRNA pseudouridine(38-40) synthase TruA [Fimbriimonadales bacterium]